MYSDNNSSILCEERISIIDKKQNIHLQYLISLLVMFNGHWSVHCTIKSVNILAMTYYLALLAMYFRLLNLCIAKFISCMLCTSIKSVLVQIWNIAISQSCLKYIFSLLSLKILLSEYKSTSCEGQHDSTLPWCYWRSYRVRYIYHCLGTIDGATGTNTSIIVWVLLTGLQGPIPLSLSGYYWRGYRDWYLYHCLGTIDGATGTDTSIIVWVLLTGLQE